MRALVVLSALVALLAACGTENTMLPEVRYYALSDQ
jgi:uncharacterized lipoprotein